MEYITLVGDGGKDVRELTHNEGRGGYNVHLSRGLVMATTIRSRKTDASSGLGRRGLFTGAAEW